MKKNEEGITLVALVITIIVMLVLARISMDAIVGDNGILRQAQEAKILTALSNVMFNLESNIVDIKLSDMNKSYTSSEMLQELSNRNLLTIVNYKLKQGKIKNEELSDPILNFNGDIWVNNYKRGKVQLSKIVNELEIYKSKILVNDGNIDRFGSDDSIVYKVSALDARDDFACWVNQYGEVISSYPDTFLVSSSIDRELTAVYGEDLKDEFLNTYGMYLVSDSKVDEDSESVTIEVNTSFNDATLFIKDKEGKITGDMAEGIKLNYLRVAFSTDIAEIEKLATYGSNPKCVYTKPITYQDMISRFLNSSDNTWNDLVKVGQYDNQNVVYIDEDNLNTNNLICYYLAKIDKNSFINAFKEEYEIDNVNRIYYCVYIDYDLKFQKYDSNTNLLSFDTWHSPFYGIENTVKYFDV